MVKLCPLQRLSEASESLERGLGLVKKGQVQETGPTSTVETIDLA